MPNRSRGESVSFGSTRPGVNPDAALPAEFKLTLQVRAPRGPQKSDAGENKSSLAHVQAFSRPYCREYVNFCVSRTWTTPSGPKKPPKWTYSLHLRRFSP